MSKRSQKRYNSVRCLMLAAGLGTRMNTSLPKPLHRIADKTMIERLIDTVKSIGIKDIVVVAGHGLGLLEDVLKKYNIKAIKQKRLLGSADAVKAAEAYFKKFSGDILVLYTDTPLITGQTIKGLIDTHINSDAACTLLTAMANNPFGYGRIIRDASGDIINIVEEKDATDQQKNIRQVNVGAYCFKKNGLFDTLAMIKINPKKGEFYLTDIVRHFKENCLKIKSFDRCPEEEALGINSRADLSAAEKIIRAKKIRQLMQEGVTFIDPDTVYIDEKAKIAKDTVIYPSVIIEGEVAIAKSCHIGPFARIRGKTVIGENCAIGNFVEIVRSKIGSGTKIKHHAYLGDSYVGSHVNVGAGVITANYDGKTKNKTVIKERAFIGVGAVLIAPVKIGKASIIGAGCVVTKNRNVPDKTTVIGVPARIFKRGEA